MSRGPRSIRTAARAFIVQDGFLLAIKMKRNGDVYYILPGGGQNHGENLHVGLQRECLEEIGSEVEIGRMLYVRDYIGRNHTFSASHSGFHQLEVVFSCKLLDSTIRPNLKPNEPDNHQVGIEWLPLENLKDFDLFPRCLRDMIVNGKLPDETVYLGDVN